LALLPPARKILLTALITKCMNSYLKQAHVKNVEKIGVSSYKLYLNFNDLLGILKNRLSLSCSKLQAKLGKLYRMCQQFPRIKIRPF
jgi:hypothetical protein